MNSRKPRRSPSATPLANNPSNEAMKNTEFKIQEKGRFGPAWRFHSGPFPSLKEARAARAAIGNRYVGDALRIRKIVTTETTVR